MKNKKLMALAVGVLALGSLSASADIGFTYQGKGGYLPGGDFTNGPFPEIGALYQVLWHPEAAPSAVDQSLVAPGEALLYDNNTVKPYGYWDPTPLIVVTEAQVPNVNTTGGTYTRLYSNGAPVAGDNYYQSPLIPNSSLPVYDAQNPATIAALSTPGGDALSSVVVPEPSTGLLLALSGVLLAVRRRMTR
mgnify:FL=1